MVKSASEIDAIRESCSIVAGVLSYIEKFLNPGITTLEIDELVEDYIKSRGGVPAFKGYKVHKNIFPASACISINEQVVHGIPGPR